MYSGNHNVTSDCWWVVRVPQGQAMQLRWDSFNVHSRLEAGVCDGNYVEVVDGLNTGSVHRLIPRYYRATIPAVHTSTTNVVSIHYVTNANNTGNTNHDDRI